MGEGMLTLLNQPRILQVPGFVLGDGTFLLGRSMRCNLIVPHATVSRRHAVFRVSGDRVEVQDLRSHNGTFVDGDCVESAELRLGHVVRLGQVSFVLARIDDEQLECESSVETASALHLAAPAPADDEVDVLSGAQRRVLDLALTGLVEKQIARRLKISRHTAHNHMRSIYRILGVHSRGELLAQLLSK